MDLRPSGHGLRMSARRLQRSAIHHHRRLIRDTKVLRHVMKERSIHGWTPRHFRLSSHGWMTPSRTATSCNRASSVTERCIAKTPHTIETNSRKNRASPRMNFHPQTPQHSWKPVAPAPWDEAQSLPTGHGRNPEQIEA